MRLKLAGEMVRLRENAIVASPPVSQSSSFSEVVCGAMDTPIDLKPIAEQCLEGKTAVVIVDDWGRPTPCSEFMPDVLRRLNQAGVPDARITIVTASGMHNPMDDEQMQKKVGMEAFRRVRCVSHDGGDRAALAFCGITRQGTPVWINRAVADADFRLIIGRIYPHSNYGYEGGYKMIVPGVASFETIVRDHSFNFSDDSDYGILRNNPSREEADAIGRLVGVDFAVNIVVDWEARPVKAFGGTPEEVFSAGVNFGQRSVWGATTGGKPADITLLCHRDMGDLSLSNNPNYYIGLAKSVTKPGGIVISTMVYRPQKHEFLYGYDLDAIPVEELFRLHEKRNWPFDERTIQHTIKTIRGVFYRRREMECRPQKLFLVSEEYPPALLEKWRAEQFPTIQAAYDEAAARSGSDPRVFAIPDAKHTLPLVRYDFPE